MIRDTDIERLTNLNDRLKDLRERHAALYVKIRQDRANDYNVVYPYFVKGKEVHPEEWFKYNLRRIQKAIIRCRALILDTLNKMREGI